MELRTRLGRANLERLFLVGVLKHLVLLQRVPFSHASLLLDVPNAFLHVLIPSALEIIVRRIAWSSSSKPIFVSLVKQELGGFGIKQ